MNFLAKTFAHAATACVLAGAVVTPALAQSATEQTLIRTVISVPTSDLDLGTREGQRKLDTRVAKAVRKVCLTTGSRSMNRDELACLAKARADAKRQVAALVTDEQRGG